MTYSQFVNNLWIKLYFFTVFLRITPKFSYIIINNHVDNYCEYFKWNKLSTVSTVDKTYDFVNKLIKCG